MKFLEKYKLYRSIIKQTPYSLSFEKKRYYGGIIEEIFHYRENGYDVHTFHKKLSDSHVKNFLLKMYMCNFPVKHYAIITNTNGVITEFNHLFAKRLFNHAKKYNK